MGSLAAVCPCGHGAFHHATQEQYRMRLEATKGQYGAECKGGTSSHCRCITTREEVMA